MTARTLVRERNSESNGGEVRDITARNIQKVTRFREGGVKALEREVGRLEREEGEGGGGKGRGREEMEKRRERAERRERVYPSQDRYGELGGG